MNVKELIKLVILWFIIICLVSWYNNKDGGITPRLNEFGQHICNKI